MELKRRSSRLRYFFPLLFFLQSLPALSGAQSLDSLKKIFSERPKFFVSLDARNSFITTSFARVYGVKAGLSFKKKIRFGIGYSVLWSNISRLEYIPGISLTDTVRLRFWYLSPGMEYTFYQKGRWQFSVPVHLGMGKSYFEYFDLTGETATYRGQFVLFYEPAVAGHFKIVKWVGIGFGTGIRLMIVSNRKIDENFNSPIYILNIKVFFDEIYRSVFPYKNTAKE